MTVYPMFLLSITSEEEWIIIYPGQQYGSLISSNGNDVLRIWQNVEVNCIIYCSVV